MYSIGIAATLLGVCIKTLRRWNKKKMITCCRTLGGHRRFPYQEIERILNNYKRENSLPSMRRNNYCAIYGRVSSHKQRKRGDLERQIALLKSYAYNNHYEVVKVYKDVGSGLNTNRKGLWGLIRDAKKQRFSTVLLNYRDRLTRFGYLYLKEYLHEYNVELLCINTLDEKTPEGELVEDLVAIIHSFSGKLYRMRRTEMSTN